MNELPEDLRHLRFGEHPPAVIPGGKSLILASSSPRRHLLLSAAGYTFQIQPPSDSAECGMCSRESPPELVARLAVQKAADVAKRLPEGLVLGADTVAECMGNILGKPATRGHAHEMLTLLRGRPHSVYTGFCLWSRPDNHMVVEVVETKLRMDSIDDEMIDDYLDTGKWEGKAGAFGYQDGNDWLQVIEGSESNIIGLPIERLGEALTQFDTQSMIVDPESV